MSIETTKKRTRTLRALAEGELRDVVGGWDSGQPDRGTAGDFIGPDLWTIDQAMPPAPPDTGNGGSGGGGGYGDRDVGGGR